LWIFVSSKLKANERRRKIKQSKKSIEVGESLEILRCDESQLKTGANHHPAFRDRAGARIMALGVKPEVGQVLA
jgi:hypothetical protein